MVAFGVGFFLTRPLFLDLYWDIWSGGMCNDCGSNDALTVFSQFGLVVALRILLTTLILNFEDLARPGGQMLAKRWLYPGWLAATLADFGGAAFALLVVAPTYFY